MGPSISHHRHLSFVDSILLIKFFHLFLWTQSLGGFGQRSKVLYWPRAPTAKVFLVVVAAIVEGVEIVRMTPIASSTYSAS